MHRTGRARRTASRISVLAVAVALWFPLAWGCGAKSAQDYFRKGEQLATAGKLDDAIEAYQTGLEMEPGSAMGYNLLGMAYRLKYNALRSTQWKQKEIAAFEQAELADSTFWPAYVNLGATLYYMGNAHDAAPHFIRALTLYPQNPEREKLEAMIREGQGEPPAPDTEGVAVDSLGTEAAEPDSQD